MRRLTPMWSRLHSSAIPMFIRKPLMAGNLFGHYGMVEAARKIDIIDARPTFTQADADALNARFEGVGTGEMLRNLFDEGTLGHIATVYSFGTERAVLLHPVGHTDPAVAVIVYDTLEFFLATQV